MAELEVEDKVEPEVAATQRETEAVYPSHRSTMKNISRVFNFFVEDRSDQEIADQLNQLPYFPQVVAAELSRLLTREEARSVPAADHEEGEENEGDETTATPTQSRKRVRSAEIHHDDEDDGEDDEGDETTATPTQSRKRVRSADVGVDSTPQETLDSLTNKASAMGVKLDVLDYIPDIQAKTRYLEDQIEEKARARLEREALIAQQNALIAQQKALKALKCFFRFKDNLENVHKALNEMARFTQAEPSCAATGVGPGTREQAMHEKEELDKKTEETGALSEFTRNLLYKPGSLDTAIFDPEKQTTPTTGIERKMTIVANVLNEWIDGATILVGVNSDGTKESFAQSKPEYKKKIEESAMWFAERVKEELKKEGKPEGKATQSDDEEGKETQSDDEEGKETQSDDEEEGKEAQSDNKEKVLFFPGVVGYEVNGCQIVVFAVLEAIAECLLWEKPSPGHVRDPYSPSKTNVMREIALAVHDSHVRKVDMVRSKDGRARLLMFDENMRLTIELMPVCRKNKSVAELLWKNRDQAVGHIAKSVGGAFNLAGFGASGKATALSGSFAFLRVHHLKLTMAELPVTPNEGECATLDYQESSLFPLMSKVSFQRVLDESRKHVNSTQFPEERHNEWQEFVQECFPNTDTDLPLGIRLLFELMQKRKHDVMGYSMEEIAVEKGIEVLGTGTSRVVVGSRRDSNAVWKVSTFSWTNHFAKEVAALSALGNDHFENTKHSRRHLPQLLEKDSTFQVKLGWKTLQLPCLKLKPRGVPVLSTRMDAEKVIVACSQISAGMGFLHSKGFIHCDISPKNIVMVDVANSHYYVLVDLGLTTKRTDKLRGFQGTVPYAAKDIFSQYPNGTWSPTVAHDRVALQYTMAALLNGGIPAWDMHPFPQYPEEGDELKTQEDDFSRVIEERKSAVESLFYKHHVHWDWGESKLIKKKN